MFLFPTAVNIFIFWITDNFLMYQTVQKQKVSVDNDDSDQELLQEENDNTTNPLA